MKKENVILCLILISNFMFLPHCHSAKWPFCQLIHSANVIFCQLAIQAKAVFVLSAVFWAKIGQRVFTSFRHSAFSRYTVGNMEFENNANSTVKARLHTLFQLFDACIFIFEQENSSSKHAKLLCVFTLVIINNLGLAQVALKTHV